MASLENRLQDSDRRLSDYFVRKSLGLGLGHALLAEIVGTCLFTFVGTASGSAVGNGLALAVAIFATANISGGHLNPAVDIAFSASGHQHWVVGILNLTFQILGGILGSLLVVLLIPHASSGACPSVHDINVLQAVGWEALLTFLLVTVIYAVFVAKGSPDFGIVGPLAIGLTVWASVTAAKGHLRLFINPARLLGPAVVFMCGGRLVWLLLLGEVAGALLAAFLYALPMLGAGSEYSGWRSTGRNIRSAAGVVAEEAESLLPGRR